MEVLADASDGVEQAIERHEEPSWLTSLRADPAALLNDAALLAELGLKRTAANVIEFAPAALARAEAAKAEALGARQALEEAARANFAAQAQTHAAVVDLLDSRNLSDLSRRVDEAARLRFGLAAGALAIERPGAVPLGWTALEPFAVDRLLGSSATSLLGPLAEPEPVFGERAARVESCAIVRLAVWAPERTAVLAFGSADTGGFTTDMGADLIAFLGRVVERVAERWPAA